MGASSNPSSMPDSDAPESLALIAKQHASVPQSQPGKFEAISLNWFSRLDWTLRIETGFLSPKFLNESCLEGEGKQ